MVTRALRCVFLSTLFSLACMISTMRPAQSGTGSSDWVTVAPSSVGLHAPRLESLTRDIRAGKYSNIHSLLVVRHGKLAVEQYFVGNDERRGEPIGKIRFDARTLHDVRSVSKSVTSALAGIALTPADLDKPVLEELPQYRDLQTPQRMAIRVRDLLSMTSGLEWDEFRHPYGNPLNSESAMDRASDRPRFVLQQHIIAERGTQFQYSGGDTTVIAKILEQRTGMPLDEYAKRMLFGPLGIVRFEWLKYEDGVPIAASGLRLLPRDMAKLGQLYLNQGRWQDAQVIPEAWVRDSLSPHATISDRAFGFQRYGYQWWLGTARVGNENVPWASAVGYGGQRILIVPSMDLVIVLTAGLYGDARQTDITFEIMLDRVLPAVKKDR